MFNTFLDTKRKWIAMIFYWIFFFATIVAVIKILKWVDLFPKPTVTNTVTIEKVNYTYKTVDQSNLGRLANGDHVKFGEVDMCVSSIQTSNLRTDDPKSAPVQINLRVDGNCQ